jgi:hypothetical protein
MANPLDLLKDLAAKFAGIEGALAKITAAEDRAKALDSEIATAKQATAAALADLDAERSAHSETKSALQKAQEEASGKDAEISTLKASIETEKNRANAVIASQALPVDQLPAAAVTQTITGNLVAPGLDPKIKGNARLLAHFSKK